MSKIINSRDLILLRSEEDNNETSKKLQNLGFNIISSPLVQRKILPLDITEFHGFNIIIITSKFTAKIISDKVNWEFEALVVGEVSSEIVKANKFCKSVKYFDKIEKLEEFLIRASLNSEKIIYFCGNNITKRLPYRICEIYYVEYVPILNNSALNLLKDSNKKKYILLYSSETARIFIRALENERLIHALENAVIIALSKKIAGLFIGLAKIIKHPDTPVEEEMINFLKNT